MALKSTPKSTVVQFRTRDRLEDEDELPVGIGHITTAISSPVMLGSKVDLTGKHKIWFVIGAGNTGKTMLIRWVSEICHANGASPIIVAADPTNRSLKNYIDVNEPLSNDPAVIAKWLEELLHHAMTEQKSVIIDLGGGDTALQRLMAGIPDLCNELSSAGIEPVAIYTLSPRVDDLSSLRTLETLGFQPAATALVCNERFSDRTVSRDEAFARIKRHSIYRAVVARGATEVWMPVLGDSDLVQEIEGKRLSFMQARDGISPPGRDRPVVPLGGFDRSKVRKWLSGMGLEMSPIATWIPTT